MAQRAYLNRIGTAVPDYDVHAEFIAWAEPRIAEPKQRALFRRMASRSGIDARWSILTGPKATEPGGFYAEQALPSTAARTRMARCSPSTARGDMPRARCGCWRVAVARSTRYDASAEPTWMRRA